MSSISSPSNNLFNPDGSPRENIDIASQLSEPCPEQSTSLRSETSSRHDEQHDGKASIVQYLDDDERKNSALQLAFDKNAQIGQYDWSIYKKVAVLLISWDVASDDLHTQSEVDRLAHVWQDIYHYKVTRSRLKSNEGKLPQVQINKDIATFVWEEDSPSTLLIVYYAGHGTPGLVPGHLELSGRRGPAIEQLDTVVWNRAESALQETNADVFEIFDCCYAGDLGRGRHFGTRCFEYLGATSSGGTTRSPGPHSFTSALMWALLELARESGTFTTSNLVAKIRDCTEFPRAQVPVLIERDNKGTLHRIALAPLSEKEGQLTSSPEEVVPPRQGWGFLVLKFTLEQEPQEAEVEKFAKRIGLIIQGTDLKTRNVKWAGLHRSAEGSTLANCEKGSQDIHGSSKRGQK